MHTYIKYPEVYEFNEEVSVGSISNELKERGITNIFDDGDGEALWELSKALYTDYILKRSNYKAFIEDGMNIRMLMELRKSALLPFGESNRYVYEEHRNAETVEDVKNIRINFFSPANPDYKDEDWQYMTLVIHCLRPCGMAKDLYISYEDCYADGDLSKQKSFIDYRRDFLKAHFQGLEGIDFDKVILTDEPQGYF